MIGLDWADLCPRTLTNASSSSMGMGKEKASLELRKNALHIAAYCKKSNPDNLSKDFPIFKILSTDFEIHS